MRFCHWLGERCYWGFIRTWAISANILFLLILFVVGFVMWAYLSFLPDPDALAQQPHLRGVPREPMSREDALDAAAGIWRAVVLMLPLWVLLLWWFYG